MSDADAAVLANPITCELGEGPVWDPVRELVLWIDIDRGAVHSGRLHGDGLVHSMGSTFFGGTVGAVAVSEEGSWLVAGSQTLTVCTTSGDRREIARIIPAGEPRRANDGACDPAGRFVVGTLAPAGDSEREVLVRLEDDGTLATIDDDLTLSNGLAWSADGRTMYSVDTLRRVVYARSYDSASGTTGERRELIAVEDGFPDGMCLDAEGHLWVAMWGLGEVRRYTPDGLLDRSIRVAAPQVSSVAFAGPDLDTLIITTAATGLADDQLLAFPQSGMLFTARPGVRGLPAQLWNGAAREGSR